MPEQGGVDDDVKVAVAGCRIFESGQQSMLRHSQRPFIQSEALIHLIYDYIYRLANRGQLGNRSVAFFEAGSDQRQYCTTEPSLSPDAVLRFRDILE